MLTQPLDKSFKIEKTDKKTNSQFALEITNLSFVYPQKSETTLRNINLAIRKGEKIGIAGSSGCGKSTFIKIILKLIHNYSGKINFLEKILVRFQEVKLLKKYLTYHKKPISFLGQSKRMLFMEFMSKKMTAILSML